MVMTGQYAVVRRIKIETPGTQRVGRLSDNDDDQRHFGFYFVGRPEEHILTFRVSCSKYTSADRTMKKLSKRRALVLIRSRQRTLRVGTRSCRTRSITSLPCRYVWIKMASIYERAVVRSALVK